MSDIIDEVQSKVCSMNVGGNFTDSSSRLMTYCFEWKLAEIAFYVYYNDESAIYYELRPFVVALKPVSEEVAIKTIPPQLLCKMGDFKDPIFDKISMRPETLFAEGSAIQYLILSSDNKQKRLLYESIHRICIHRVETERILQTHTYIRKLEKQQHKHTTLLDLLSQLLTTISNKHDDISTAIKALFPHNK